MTSTHHSTDHASWFTSLFGFDEETQSAAAWSHTRSRFSYAPATGILTAPSGDFHAGRFSTPTLGDVRAAGRALLVAGAPPTLTLSHGITNDVLNAHARAPPGSVFLAASGLNCLEFPGHGGSPMMGVTCYEDDRTQGPACALACAAGTVVRNYFSDNTPDAQLDCLSSLADAVGDSAACTPWVVRAGYILGSSRDGAAAAAALDVANARVFARGSASRAALRALVRVGVQEDTGVTFASRWARADAALRVTQVYAAALSLGGYKTPRDVPDEAWAPLATLVLEAAYEATLWAGVAAAARAGVPRGSVYLCGLGLGVFGNEPEWVATAIGRAVATLRAEGAALDVHFLHFREIHAGLRGSIDAAAARTDYD